MRTWSAGWAAADAVDALTDQLAAMSGPTPAPVHPAGDPTSAQHSPTTSTGPWWEQTWSTTADGVSHAAQEFGDIATSVSGYYAAHPVMATAPQVLPADLVDEGHPIPVARVAAMHEGRRHARAHRPDRAAP